jgi:hypothetical protein
MWLRHGDPRRQSRAKIFRGSATCFQALKVGGSDFFDSPLEFGYYLSQSKAALSSRSNIPLQVSLSPTSFKCLRFDENLQV